MVLQVALQNHPLLLLPGGRHRQLGVGGGGVRTPNTVLSSSPRGASCPAQLSSPSLPRCPPFPQGDRPPPSALQLGTSPHLKQTLPPRGLAPDGGAVEYQSQGPAQGWPRGLITWSSQVQQGKSFKETDQRGEEEEEGYRGSQCQPLLVGTDRLHGFLSCSRI